jgi:hypothetical protein
LEWWGKTEVGRKRKTDDCGDLKAEDTKKFLMAKEMTE